MLRPLESGRLDAVLQVAWQLTVAALRLYVPMREPSLLQRTPLALQYVKNSWPTR